MYVPTAHVLSAAQLVLPGEDANFPDTHAAHTVLPDMDAYVPAAHAVQALNTALPPKEPTGQLVHTAEATPEYVPAPQSTQPVDQDA